VVKKQPVAKGVIKVSKDVLCDYEMRLMGIVHVEAHLSDCVGMVRPSEGEVLESLDQATIDNQVTNRVPCQKRFWHECRPAWSWACSCSCQHAQGCPEHTGAGDGRGRHVVTPLRHQGSGEEAEVHRELLPENHSGTLEKLAGQCHRYRAVGKQCRCHDSRRILRCLTWPPRSRVRPSRRRSSGTRLTVPVSSRRRTC
jgi:hypothetical protein